jgi:carboxypeptidase Q
MSSRTMGGMIQAGVCCAVLLCAVQVRAQSQPPAQLQLPPQGGIFSPPTLKGENACSPTASCADVAPGIIQRALGGSPLEENLRQLTDNVGGRVTGSPEGKKAVAWALEAFRQAGVDSVHTERFTIPNGWSEGATHLEVIGRENFPVRLVSIAWSPATPIGGITAPVVDVGAGDDAGFSHAGNATKGAIVLVHSEVLKTLDQLFEEYLRAPAIVNRAEHAGALAILWMSSRQNLLLYRHILSLDGKVRGIPQAIVAREDAERIARILAHGQGMRVHFDMPNRVTGPVKSENVIAEIRGRDKPDEFVLLGAHLDSWELGTGALDNGCNAAMVVEAARLIHTSGAVPRRSIRFALFTGEEQGMLGSAAYARAHRAELDGMIAAIVFDDGSGRATGFLVSGRTDLVDELRTDLKPAAQLQAGEVIADAELGTDNFDFLLEGVPTLIANQEPANYMVNYHAASDTFDKVDILQLKKNAALASITAYAIADAPQRLGKRQSRAEIEQLLRQTELWDQMRQMDFLRFWLDGSRGRQQ